MNETLKSTFDMMRAIAKAKDIKIKRGFTDFLADRIIQACTKSNLIAMSERILSMLNSDITYINGNVLSEFMKNSNKTDASAVMNWIREYPRIAAMIIQSDEKAYADALNTIEIICEAQEIGIALPSAEYDIGINFTCLSPLAHGSDTKAGNATLFRRMQILSTTGKILTLPYYAGNAIRGQLRDILADHYLKSLGITPSKSAHQCSLWFFHSIYAGGALEENSEQAKILSKKIGSSGAARIEGINEFRNMIPTVSLLGTALGNRIISGRINIGDCRPQCLEWANGDVSVGELFEWTYLTRREDHENHASGENSSMFANTECLKAGTVLHGGIDVGVHISDIEKSCLGTGLRLLQDIGYLGAENRRGFGQVKIDIKNLPDSDLYESYLDKNRNNILDYLNEIKAITNQKEMI